MTRFRLFLFSAIYWFVVLSLLGFVTTFWADCGTGGGTVSRCSPEKEIVGWAGIGVAALIYGTLWFIADRRHLRH